MSFVKYFFNNFSENQRKYVKDDLIKTIQDSYRKLLETQNHNIDGQITAFVNVNIFPNEPGLGDEHLHFFLP